MDAVVFMSIEWFISRFCGLFSGSAGYVLIDLFGDSVL
jgi:hypothetical protein